MEQTLEQVDRTIDKAQKHKGYVNVSEALKLRLKHNLSYEELGERYGVTKQAVHQALRKFSIIIDRPESIGDFNAVRSDVLTAVEFKLIESLLDQEKHKDASLNNVAYAYQTIFHANRLEKGESTNNISLFHHTVKRAWTQDEPQSDSQDG
jgi:predicted DNA-binding protein YlxM (UPF0122 family)